MTEQGCVDLELVFEELYYQYGEKNNAVWDIRNKIMALEKEMEEISNPFDDKISELRSIIIEEVKCRNESFKCLCGSASFRKGYERTSWDSKALMGYAAAHPEIEQFKKTTAVEASVTISIDIFSEKDGEQA